MAARTPRKGTSRYKVTNKNYDASLVNRGSITIWISEDAISKWHPQIEDKKQGGQTLYSDLAIQTCLTMRLIYSLPLRQTEGFMNSIFSIMKIDINSPDHSTLSRRTEDLETIRRSLKKEGAINVLIDSTGLKICGSGEWEEEKHGKGRRKIWRKLHLGVDEETLQIVASTLTDHLTSDPSQVAPLLEQVESKVDTVKADGAYDQDPLYQHLNKKGIKGIFPPRKDAILSKNSAHDPTQRDLNILRIQKDGREVWEYASGYSKRNLVENAMFRYKNNIGKLHSKTFKRQQVETTLGVHLLNQMTKLGMPESVRVR